MIFVGNFFKRNINNYSIPLIPYDLIFVLMLNLIFGYQIAYPIK